MKRLRPNEGPWKTNVHAEMPKMDVNITESHYEIIESVVKYHMNILTKIRKIIDSSDEVRFHLSYIMLNTFL
jgi:hypothetical protein